MSKKQELMLKAFKGFEGDKPRRLLHEGEWYFSVVDTVEVLTDQPTIQRAQLYWRVLKKRIKAESVTNCNDLIQLKQTASDGKSIAPCLPESIKQIANSSRQKKVSHAN